MLLVKDSTTIPDIDQEELSYELDQVQFWKEQYHKDLDQAIASSQLYVKHTKRIKELLYAQKS